MLAILTLLAHMHKTHTLTLLEIDTVIMYDNVGIKYI